jgi:hypothetical protein
MHTLLRVTGVLSGVESSVVLGLGFGGWAAPEPVHQPAHVVPGHPRRGDVLQVGEGVLALFLLFSFLNAMNGTLTGIYPGEVFPTEVRGLGTGFAAAVSRIGAGLGTFLLPITIEKFGVPATILAMAVIVFSGAVVSQLWAPETKGKSLSETAAGYSH